MLRGESEALSFDEKTWLKYSKFPKRSQVWVVDREKVQSNQAKFDLLDESQDEDITQEDEFDINPVHD